MTTQTTHEEESAGDFLCRVGIDGKKWAHEFRLIAIKLGYSDMEEDWLHSWFANAIMAGYDYSHSPTNGDHAQFLLDREKANAKR